MRDPAADRKVLPSAADGGEEAEEGHGVPVGAAGGAPTAAAGLRSHREMVGGPGDFRGRSVERTEADQRAVREGCSVSVDGDGGICQRQAGGGGGAESGALPGDEL